MTSNFIYLPNEQKIIDTDNIGLIEVDAGHSLEELVTYLEKPKEEREVNTPEMVIAIHLKVPAGRIIKVKSETVKSFWEKINAIKKGEMK